MTVTPRIPGRRVTTRQLQFPTIEQVEVVDQVVGSGQPLRPPVFDVPTIQIPSVWVNTVADDPVSAGDRFELELWGGPTGQLASVFFADLLGQDIQEIGEGENRLSFCIPMGRPTRVPAGPRPNPGSGTDWSWIFTARVGTLSGSGSLQRLFGSNSTWFSVLILPDETPEPG